MRSSKTINRRAQLIDWLAPLAAGGGKCLKQPHATRAAAWKHLQLSPLPRLARGGSW